MNISKKKAINLLEEIYQIANHSTLTGALEDGGESLVATFNNIKDLSLKNKWTDDELLAGLLSINAETTMANIGTSARLLAKMLEDEEAIEALEAPQAAEAPQASEAPQAPKNEKYDENGYEIKDSQT